VDEGHCRPYDGKLLRNERWRSTSCFWPTSSPARIGSS
jgi:hypothetical protein